MRLYEWLKIEKGVTAVIGSGGKTSLIHTLAGELSGRVIVCTTTRIYPPEDLYTLIFPSEAELDDALALNRVVCAGEPAEFGKLKALNLPMETLVKLADYVLVEADGAKNMPLKAHAAYEPVIPALAAQTICVVGASGFGRPVFDAVHRPERFAELAGVLEQDAATPERVAKVIAAEGLSDRIFINQAETQERLAQAKQLAKHIELPVIAGSLGSGKYQILK